jgi:hypothetical protein
MIWPASEEVISLGYTAASTEAIAAAASLRFRPLAFRMRKVGPFAAGECNRGKLRSAGMSSALASSIAFLVRASASPSKSAFSVAFRA